MNADDLNTMVGYMGAMMMIGFMGTVMKSFIQPDTLTPQRVYHIRQDTTRVQAKDLPADIRAVMIRAGVDPDVGEYTLIEGIIWAVAADGWRAGELHYRLVPSVCTYVMWAEVEEPYRRSGLGRAMAELLREEVIKYDAAPVVGDVLAGAKGFWRTLGYMTQSATMPRPVYDIPEGRYDWSQVRASDPRGAESASMVAAGEGLPSLTGYHWDYRQVPIGETKIETGTPTSAWAKVFSKYEYLSEDDIMEWVRTGRMPITDIRVLCEHPERLGAVLPGGIRSDFTAYKHIAREVREQKIYYPPILLEDLVVLDGAHRLAAFYNVLGPEVRILAWVRVPPALRAQATVPPKPSGYGWWDRIPAWEWENYWTKTKPLIDGGILPKGYAIVTPMGLAYPYVVLKQNDKTRWYVIYAYGTAMVKDAVGPGMAVSAYHAGRAELETYPWELWQRAMDNPGTPVMYYGG